MSAAATLLAGDALILTDGGIETRLTFELGVALPEPLGSAALVGTDALRAVYGSYIPAARAHDLPVAIGTPTFRAGARYAEAAGVDVAEVNAAAVHHHQDLREAAGPGAPVLIALGCVRAMTATGLPAVISYVLGRDGRVLDGTELAAAVDRIDAEADPPPLFHSLSCIHADVAARALEGVPPGRVLECKANGSPLAPAELVALDHLESDPPETFAADMWRLHTEHGLRVLGGCCGTDDRHMRVLGARMAGL